jgi:hypothetical protein
LLSRQRKSELDFDPVEQKKINSEAFEQMFEKENENKKLKEISNINSFHFLVQFAQ